VSRSLPAELPPSLPSAAVTLELLKPITWFPPMWAFLCGIVSSGAAIQGHWALAVGGIVLCGPMLCACSQAVNDWFDRHVDAINEPQRPIPSGRMPGRWGLYIAFIWTGLSLALAALLGPRVLAVAFAGVLFAWAYSAPPIRLKQNGWWGNLACGFCYEGFAWLTGAAVLISGWPTGPIIMVATLYSLGAHGIMTLNDFKAIEGDRRMGVRSLPVRLGVTGAARVACLAMALSQAVVIACLIGWGRPWHALAVAVLLLVQWLMMRRFLSDPCKYALWYSGAGVPVYVLGMLISAFALRALPV
jgi:chlorophyll/bacteriochlorophyll a synthase